MLLQVMLQRPHPRLQSLQAGLKLLLESDLREQLQDIQQPVLWIHGERDRLCPVSAAQWATQQLPQATLEIFSAAGHEPFISHPQQFVHSVNAFLGTSSS
jgi:pimeloyl-[acyl-carrier protein] methyl ester esterase